MKFTSIFAAGVLICSATARAVHKSSKPGLIPGPGMPTLEELGLTEDDLKHPPANFNFELTEDDLVARAGQHTVPGCSANPPSLITDLNHAINYLANVNQNCTIPSMGAISTVQYNSAYVFLGLNQYGSATTPCSVVAKFSQKIADACVSHRNVSGTQFLPRRTYTNKKFKKDNMSVFVDIYNYGADSGS